jgi:hypothetical protein
MPCNVILDMMARVAAAARSPSTSTDFSTDSRLILLLLFSLKVTGPARGAASPAEHVSNTQIQYNKSALAPSFALDPFGQLWGA